MLSLLSPDTPTSQIDLQSPINARRIPAGGTPMVNETAAEARASLEFIL
jgi:hypothetical protein